MVAGAFLWQINDLLKKSARPNAHPKQ